MLERDIVRLSPEHLQLKYIYIIYYYLFGDRE